MKKSLIAGGVVLIVLLIGFFVLLGKASPENAPQDVQTIELPDTFEK